MTCLYSPNFIQIHEGPRVEICPASPITSAIGFYNNLYIVLPYKPSW